MENFHEYLIKGWTKHDKFLFYEALRSYGSGNVKTLQEHIPNKTKKEIEQALLYFRLKTIKQEEEVDKCQESERLKRPTHVPLSGWAKLLIETVPLKELRTKTALAVRFIAETEDIPPAECTENIDFRKVYHTIANALEGKVLCEDKRVAEVLDECLTETALTCKAYMRFATVIKALKDIQIKEEHLAFQKPTADIELLAIRHILKHKGYNPLNIPEEHLKPSSFLK